MASLILSHERYILKHYDKPKTHLLYAKEIETENKEDDIFVGIGEKVTSVKIKIDKKFTEIFTKVDNITTQLNT